ncbi:MAG: PEP/pyruvate-binding domain-containing protein [Desulfobacterales bacterium]
MRGLLAPQAIGPQDRPRVGGKALRLAGLRRAGFRVPDFLCLPAEAYRRFCAFRGLSERIGLELARKDFAEMRWEELWDCATRIRSLFLRHPFPPELEAGLREGLARRFGDGPVAVRSSALEEDTAGASFAGLHASFVQVSGVDATLERIRLVWASLWSDAALLYRRELGLDPERSAMAVIVQEMAVGEVSGVCFSRNPAAPGQAVVEAAWGLNEAVVDGSVAPDRWLVDRTPPRILEHQPPPQRRRRLVAAPEGARFEDLPAALAGTPPLSPTEVLAVVELARRAEEHFGEPQDIEWTRRGRELLLLQSRPTTARRGGEGEDARSWYLGLRRSFENLKRLRAEIEGRRIPEAERTAAELAAVDLARLSDAELVAEIERRRAIRRRWQEIYDAEFIPFAHGMRLFGEVYNERLKPGDPYEFTSLLRKGGLLSLERNRALARLAAAVRERPELACCLDAGDCAEAAADFQRELEAFLRRFGDFTCELGGRALCAGALQPLARLLREMARRPAAAPRPEAADASRLEEAFLASFPPERRGEAAELLDLARASWRLRDDDNLHVGRIEARLREAEAEGRRRLAAGAGEAAALERVLAAAAAPAPPAEAGEEEGDPSIRPRQLRGQPAGPGFARGPARVIRSPDDLERFTAGEVLVCDAVDPRMTHVVPLAAAIVERRGGMLIHGAIIAREYGIPCVTGVPEAVRRIRTGDALAVDGYLGIVTVGGGELCGGDPPGGGCSSA